MRPGAQLLLITLKIPEYFLPLAPGSPDTQVTNFPIKGNVLWRHLGPVA